MQRHKKYLIITIWISAIALVASGMVGWDPTLFSFSGDSVAKVGKTSISQVQFARAYDRVFNEYNEVLGGKLDQAEAKRYGLDKEALRQLIQRAQLESYAKDIGLQVSDSDVVKEIAKDPSFQRNGIFDPALYKQLLSENRINASEFEDSIRSTILIQNILNMLPKNTTKIEEQAISGILQLNENIAYQVITPKNPPDPTNEAIKSFWEANKAKYKNPPEITLSGIKINIDDQKVSELEARKYFDDNQALYTQDANKTTYDQFRSKVLQDLKTKRAEQKALELAPKIRDRDKSEKTQDFTITLDALNSDFKAVLNIAKEGDFIKPELYENAYILGNVIKVQKDSEKSFEQAKAEAKLDLIKEQKLQNALKLAKEIEAKSDFTKDAKTRIANINTFDAKILFPLNRDISLELIRQIYGSQNPSGIVQLSSNQVVIYKILEQNLAQTPHIPQNFAEFAANLKAQYIDKSLVAFLNTKYPAKIYESNIEQSLQQGGHNFGH